MFNSRITVIILTTVFLAGCSNNGSSNSDIEQGYANAIKSEFENAIKEAGGIDKVAGIDRDMAAITYKIQKTSCEKSPTQTGWNCIYNATAYNKAGKELPGQPVRNIEGRVYKIDTGWMVEEKPKARP